MKPKLVIAECNVILLIALFTSQSNGAINYETDTQPKIDTLNTKPQSKNNQSDHLFYFVQVSSNYNYNYIVKFINIRFLSTS